MSKKIIIFLSTETLIILILLIKIVDQIKLRKTSITVVNAKNLSFNKQNSSLKYYFEPIPNFIEKVPKEIAWSHAIYTINSDSLNERMEYYIIPLKKHLELLL